LAESGFLTRIESTGGRSGQFVPASARSDILLEQPERAIAMTQCDRRVPASTICRWMDGWKHVLTVEEILNYRPD
jgi:hypothetical protein